MKLTGKQSRAARALLKWNLHDLAAKVRTPVKRIDNFEKGVIHLQKFENEELIDAYKKEGVEFKGDFEVTLKGKKPSESMRSGDGGMQVVLSMEELTQSQEETPEEEAERLKRKKPG